LKAGSQRTLLNGLQRFWKELGDRLSGVPDSPRRPPLRGYMEVGEWEGTLMNLPNRSFRDVLRARGGSVDYREFMGVHDYACWRVSLDEGLKSLIGREPATG
jgi:S-formylglutathione hydrolase FrmB